jgi:arylformamidase
MTGARAHVWRDMTQAELDAAYNQEVYAPNRKQLLERYGVLSAAVRERFGEPERLAYGDGAKEHLDIYRANSDGTAPVMVFVHGGAWRSGTARDYAFPAKTVLPAGVHLVVIEFDWVQDRDGDLMPIANQVQRAIAWVWRNAATFGGDRNRIYLAGHSSGAHMAGVALTSDWPRDFDVPSDIIKAALLCSGMYEMEPVRLSARSSYVSFTDESAQALSAMRHLERIRVPLIVAYGTRETPEFQRQTQDFHDALAARQHPVELLVADGLNHFEILETLAEPGGLLAKAALRQIFG